MPARRVARRALIVLLVLLIAGLTASFLARRALGEYLVLSEPAVKAQIALVLGGDWTGGRILEGAELARKGLVSKVWVSGPMNLYGVNEASLAIDFAVRQGYPRDLFEPKVLPAMSTREEALAFQREFDRNGIRSILLVTSNFHTRRAGGVFRRVLGPSYDLHIIAAPYQNYHPEDWWARREDRKTWFFEWSKTFGDALGL